ncbi:MAG: MBL fold metallo-hydrolase [Marinifilaceae bacterium]|jgi:L-ascorbate metabolism protein UlaG (beta-lactamase superfamily)|nr:MBL fold metallo-hydrolase [Marinifilaceae bacterium]
MKKLSILIALFAIISCNTKNKETMEKTKIQLIRNASLKIQYAGKTLLVDPMLSPKNSFMSFVERDKNLNPTIDLSTPIDSIVSNVDAVLLTHAHPDHFDPAAMEILNKDLKILAQSSDKAILSESPFNNIQYIEKTANYDNINITKIIGKHGPDELLPTLGVSSGYILKAPDCPSIYIIGDCLLDQDIKNAIATYTPNIIITNSGGAMFMGTNQILMNDENTIELAKLAPNAKIVAVHMEALDHCTITRNMLREKAKTNNVEILIPEDGETIEL